MYPILHRELLELLRTKKVLALQAVLALAALLLVMVRWPTAAVADLNGARSLQVLRILGYGLMACIILLVPAVPSATLVREKIKGTLPLLLNSPLPPWAIYFGKLFGVLGFTAILLMMTLPAAAACYALGGTGSRGGIVILYAIFGMATLQLATLSLLVSAYSQSTDGAMRTSYSLVLALCIIPLGMHALLRVSGQEISTISSWLRCLSPIPPVMEILGHGDVGMQGLTGVGADAVSRYVLLASLCSLAFAIVTIYRLQSHLLDRARASGVMTQDRTRGQRTMRRFLFLVDPQRRSTCQSLWINPVLVKEFRSRRFGRSHWMIRLIAICAILSLGITYIAASGALGWSIEYIGALLVLLQVALLILFAPNLAAGLISSERETGSWQLLRMTPLSTGKILRGKLFSVAWPIFLLLCATLPGYVVMMTIQPSTIHLVYRVIICLALTAVFVVLVSAVSSTMFRSTAQATTTAYIILLAICIGPLLIWFGRDAPFGHDIVEAVLMISPVAAAIQASGNPEFAQYQLLPLNWWLIGGISLVLLIFFGLQIRRLNRPE